MADLRTLVERDMDRAGTPAYTFDDLSRWRDRRRRTQQLTLVTVALVIAALGIAGLVRAWDPAAPPTPASEGEGPVGERIAFTGRGRSIGVIDADGGEVRWLLTERADNPSSPAWSPDGSKIAFSGTSFTIIEQDDGPDRAIGHESIYVINADGTGLARLTPAKRRGDTVPAWSPDGTRIAFYRERISMGGMLGHDVYVMNADGSGLRRLTHEADEPIPSAERLDWSSDGSEVIVSTLLRDGLPYEYVYEFVAIDGETGGRRRLAGPIFLGTIDFTIGKKAPVLSPDGTRVAFVMEGSLYVANADGSGQNMIDDGARIGEDVEWFPGALTWSPDGTRIAALGVVTIGGPDDPDDWGLFVIDAEGSWLVRLTEHQALDPAW